MGRVPLSVPPCEVPKYTYRMMESGTPPLLEAPNRNTSMFQKVCAVDKFAACQQIGRDCHYNKKLLQAVCRQPVVSRLLHMYYKEGFHPSLFYVFRDTPLP